MVAIATYLTLPFAIAFVNLLACARMCAFISVSRARAAMRMCGVRGLRGNTPMNAVLLKALT